MHVAIGKMLLTIGVASLLLTGAKAEKTRNQVVREESRATVPINLAKYGIDPDKVQNHTVVKSSAATETLQAESGISMQPLSMQTTTETLSGAGIEGAAATSTTSLTEPDFDSTTWPGWEFYTSLPEDSLVRWHVTNSPAGPDWDADGYDTNRALYIGNPYARDFEYHGWAHHHWARSPVINVPQAETVTIQWRDWHKNEDYAGGYWDSCYFYVHDLDTGAYHLLTHWYAWWEGNPYQPYWVTYEFTISQVAGHQIQIYLVFDTGDGLYNRVDVFGQRVYGWFVDDILIQADNQVIYNEPFGDESRAGTNIRVLDTVATQNNLTIDDATFTLLPDSQAVSEDGSTTLEWLIPQIAIDEEIIISFTTLLEDLIPNEVRTVNQGLELDYISVAGTIVTETIGPQSVRVELPVALMVDVEKLHYFADEEAKVDVAFRFGANSVSDIVGESWMDGAFENTTATFESGKLSLAVLETRPVDQPVVNGDFESGTSNGWHDHGFYVYATSSAPLQGSFSLAGEPFGVGYFYQDVAIPENIYSATLSLLDFKEYRQTSAGDEYRIEIRDPASPNVILKTLYSNNSPGWQATSRVFDVAEFAGQSVRLAFYAKSYYGTLMKFDDIAIEVTSYTFAESGTATYVIDAGSTVSWDTIRIESRMPQETACSVKARSANNPNDLALMPFAPMIVDNNVIYARIEPSRYLELEFDLSTANPDTTPLIESVKANYFKVQPGDLLQLKVSVFDADNSLVKELVTRRINPAQGREQTLPLTFNTANNAPGAYVAKGVICLNGVPVVDAADLFEIVEAEVTQILDGAITSDKIEYAAADSVAIASAVLNRSVNVQLRNISVGVVILDAGNEVVKEFDPYIIDTLLPDSRNLKTLTVAGGELNSGNFTARQAISINGQIVSLNETTFRVVDSITHGKGFAGSLKAVPGVVKRRIEDMSFDITASNTGNTDLNDVVFKVIIFDPVALTELQTLDSSATAIPTATTRNEILSYDGKVELMPGTYPATLTAEFTHDGVNYVMPLDTCGFVVTNSAPVANAGSDTVITTYQPGGATVTLDGSGSTDENSTDEAKKNDIVSYEWKRDGASLGTGEILDVNLAAGVHEIVLTVTDTCGATGSDTVQVTVNLIVLPPTISDLHPADNTITRELALSAKVDDPIWEIDWSSLVFKVGSAPLTAGYDATSGVVVAALPDNAFDGWHDLNIFIKNQGGADATTPEWRVGLDRTPPDIAEFAPAADVYGNNPQPTISAVITDAFSGVNATTVSVKLGETILDHAFDAATGAVAAAVPSELASGWHFATVSAADMVGNIGSATWRVGIDLLPPAIASLFPAADSEIEQADTEISAFVSDTLSGVDADSIVLELDGSPVAHAFDPETGKVSFNAVAMSEGTHTLFIVASDNAGNTADTSWTFDVRLQIPGSEYLLFHNSSGGELTITGGNKTVNGKAHSNAAIRIRGNNTTIAGQAAAVGSISIQGNNHHVPLQQPNAPAVPLPVYPYDYYVANAIQVHNANLTIAQGQTLQPGIHLVNGNVMIRSTTLNGVTIVATGDIKLASNNIVMTHGDGKYRVALYSRNGNIDSSVNNLTVTGVVYVPAGKIKVRSNNSSFIGAIVADEVEFNGQNLTLSPIP